MQAGAPFSRFQGTHFLTSFWGAFGAQNLHGRLMGGTFGPQGLPKEKFIFKTGPKNRARRLPKGFLVDFGRAPIKVRLSGRARGWPGTARV